MSYKLDRRPAFLLRLIFSTCALVAVLGVGLAPTARAGNDPNECDAAGEEPDVIVGSLYNKMRHGRVGDITAFSIGTTSCNIGTCWLNWFDDPDNRHPVIGQNMFRLKDGRFEHIGQSWLKHGFTALAGNLCFNDCITPPNGQHLGVHCSDPYSAFLNGQQTNLGPKFEVNVAKGIHPHPFTGQGQSGSAIFKRLQVHDVDIDPDLNPGALYFVEGQYVTEDDATAGNQDNNASWRQITVDEPASNFFDIELISSTMREEPAIEAWAAFESGVNISGITVPADGLLLLGSKATDLGGGFWHYEYALQNLTSKRNARSFQIPVPSGAPIANIGFHDVDYHSGDGENNITYDGIDWAVTLGTTNITWQTQTFGENSNANALRWGTLYNFRFDANVAPAATLGDATIGLFLPDTVMQVTGAAVIPTQCNLNSICDPGEECVCDDCPDDGPDNDFDTVGVCVDCNDADDTIWGTPGEVPITMLLDHSDTLEETTLMWDPPADPGGTALNYETLRSPTPNNFNSPATDCLIAPDPTQLFYVDDEEPLQDRLFSYLTRATNLCAVGVGTLGFNSGFDPDFTPVERTGRTCP